MDERGDPRPRPVSVLQHPPRKLWLATCALLVSIAMFSGVYTAMSHYSTAPPFEGFDRKRRLTFGEALYFATVTQSTVGYGNIGPSSMEAKIACAVQASTTMAIGLFLAS